MVVVDVAVVVRMNAPLTFIGNWIRICRFHMSSWLFHNYPYCCKESNNKDVRSLSLSLISTLLF